MYITLLIIVSFVAGISIGWLLKERSYNKMRQAHISRNMRFFENGKEVNYANVYDIWHKTETGWDHYTAQIENGELKYYTDGKLVSHKDVIENS